MERWELHELDAPDGTRDPIVLHTSDEGRAVMIRIDPGQEMRDHQVKERAWILVVDGTLQVEGDGETVQAGPGAFFTFDPNERHAVRSDSGARMLLLLTPWPGAGHYRGH